MTFNVLLPQSVPQYPCLTNLAVLLLCTARQHELVRDSLRQLLLCMDSTGRVSSGRPCSTPWSRTDPGGRASRRHEPAGLHGTGCISQVLSLHNSWVQLQACSSQGRTQHCERAALLRVQVRAAVGVVATAHGARRPVPGHLPPLCRGRGTARRGHACFRRASR